jgi:hypothetical protein
MGSPRGYTAAIGCCQQPTQQPGRGEPHERYSLYRTRRPQEKHQLLREDRRRADCGRRQTARPTCSFATLGGRSEAGLAWSYGSHAFQCLDLRHPETICSATGNGSSRKDGGHYLRQEKKRLHRCPHNRRSAALQSVANVLRFSTALARSTTSAALSQFGRAPICTHAKQDGWSADGERTCCA